MTDPWKILEDPLYPPPPSRWRRAVPYGLGVAAVLVIVLVVWGSLEWLQRQTEPANWKMLVAAAVGAVFVLAVLWKVPHWQVKQLTGIGSKERFDRVNEARRTLALIVGAMALVASFYAAVLDRRVAQKSVALAREKQAAERFRKAIEQMGAMDPSGKKNLEVRSGGIYTMERIANESENDHWPAVEVLAAYVRGNSPRTQPPAKNTQASAPSGVKPAPDVQSVVTAIARRNLQWEYLRPVLDLHETDLRGANLFQARLIRADLSAADLSGANLTEASLIRADLSGADLSWADFNGAQLTGADLSGAVLRGAKMGGAFLTDARLLQANLTQAKLDGADLRRADLTGADLNGAELGEADLSGADLSSARNLSQQQIEKAKGNVATKLPEGRKMPEAWKTGGK